MTWNHWMSTVLLFLLGFMNHLSAKNWQQVSKEKCTYLIQGVVYDHSTKAPLPYASVLIEKVNIGTTTDENGHFIIEKLCEKEYDLAISFIGYKTLRHHHDFHHSNIEIYLAPDEMMLESILVEAEHTESGLSTTTSTKLSAKEMVLEQSSSLGELTSRIPGLTTISSGQNVVKPVIHGLHSNRILLINNGLRHEFQNWGTDHAPEIDPSLIDQVEVIKGAATVRFGPNALGGVILVNPEKLELSTPLHGEVNLTGKSNGRSGEGSAMLSKGFKRLSLQAEAAWLKQGDLHTPDYNLSNTGKVEASYSANARLHLLPELDIDLYYSHFNQELGLLRGAVNGNLEDLMFALENQIPNDTRSFSYAIGTPKQEIAHDLVKAKMHYIGEHQSFSLQYGLQLNNRKEFDVRRGNLNETPNIDLDLMTQSLDAEWIHPQWKKWNGRMGLHWSFQDNENQPGTNTTPFLPNFESQRIGAYIIEQLEIGEQTFEAGLRYDLIHTDLVGREASGDLFSNTLNYQNLTASLGYKIKLTDYETFRTNLGTAWRPPDVSELYRFGRHLTAIEYGLWRYQFSDDESITTNQVLTEKEREAKPEVGIKWISSYEVKRPNYQLEFTGYVNLINDYIYARPAGITRTVRGAAPYFIYDQTDALFWGLDVAGSLIHRENLSSEFKASYLWSGQLKTQDHFVGQPPAQLSYAINWEPTVDFFGKMSFRLSADYTFRQFQTPRTISIAELLDASNQGTNLFSEDAADFDILEASNGYLLTNFAWIANINHVEWRFQVKNLFNQRYRNYTDRMRYFADEVGRNFILSINYKF